MDNTRIIYIYIYKIYYYRKINYFTYLQIIELSFVPSLGVRIRIGGHDYDGLSHASSVPFIMVDLFNMRSITVQYHGAWMMSGAKLGEVYYRIAEKSKIHSYPAGVCPAVGVGSHLSGGGYGNLMSKYGFSVDNIVDAVVVDASGDGLDREREGGIFSELSEEVVELVLFHGKLD